MKSIINSAYVLGLRNCLASCMVRERDSVKVNGIHVLDEAYKYLD